jgi:hypothetical protein
MVHAGREFSPFARTLHRCDLTRPLHDPAHTQALASDVIDRIMALPTNQRIATYLHYVEQWTGTEIADLLGITSGAVGAHIHRGTARTRIAISADASGSVVVCGRDMSVSKSVNSRGGCGAWLLLLLIAGLVALAELRPSLLPWILGTVVGVIAVSCVTWAVTRVVRKVRWQRKTTNSDDDRETSSQ